MCSTPISISLADLLLDCTTVQVFRPRAPFNEAKLYYDSKNHIYSLKKEVAVMVSESHYCLFISKAYVGSVHDYYIHKQGCSKYEEYLMKTPHEQSFMPQDIHKLKWAIVEDKGYVGPPSDTPNERRVVPIRPARLHHEIDFNNRISQFRVPIEKFNHHIMFNRSCGMDSTFYLSYLKYRIENEENSLIYYSSSSHHV